MTLCCVEAVDRLRHKAQPQIRNITFAATCSVLCCIQHKTDAMTGEHGDLLDLIAASRGFGQLRDALAEARVFLSPPRPESPRHLSLRVAGSSLRSRASSAVPAAAPSGPLTGGSGEAARRLFQAGRPIIGTPAEAYLRARGIFAPLDASNLRYHPAVYYRAHEGVPRQVWPALLAAVTDPEGRITGVHRTWLDPARPAKAPLADPRRALGHLLGNGVRFGTGRGVLAAGEGLETILSLKSVLPALPMIAGLSANHLAALWLPPPLRRLYVARDNDEAGCRAAERLRIRGAASGLEVRDLVPVLDDFNTDLVQLGPAAMLRSLVPQLVPADRVRFVPPEFRRGGRGGT
ncbi:toprim domain-containing protein [Acidiphilium iwatense]|uniref:Toprim domain-containing protein n=1 Tax=Acidiphilium iwatense TaxID=768198 RepID=A0ABS9E380_9PROT|nr:toprim domain-containing protein [Acidiphilium iwatense]